MSSLGRAATDAGCRSECSARWLRKPHVTSTSMPRRTSTHSAVSGPENTACIRESRTCPATPSGAPRWLLVSRADATVSRPSRVLFTAIPRRPFRLSGGGRPSLPLPRVAPLAGGGEPAAEQARREFAGRFSFAWQSITLITGDVGDRWFCSAAAVIVGVVDDVAFQIARGEARWGGILAFGLVRLG